LFAASNLPSTILSLASASSCACCALIANLARCSDESKLHPSTPTKQSSTNQFVTLCSQFVLSVPCRLLRCFVSLHLRCSVGLSLFHHRFFQSKCSRLGISQLCLQLAHLVGAGASEPLQHPQTRQCVHWQHASWQRSSPAFAPLSSASRAGWTGYAAAGFA